MLLGRLAVHVSGWIESSSLCYMVGLLYMLTLLPGLDRK